MRRLLLPLFFLGALVWASKAEATRFRRPFNPGARVTAHYDEDRRSGYLKDQQCGTWTYDNHTGTDLGVYFTDVLAVANATVIQTAQGCADYGGVGNQCNTGCGNFVRLRFDDGNTGLFCHMKNGSIAVSTGQRVSCGQRIGTSASSGNSTGPHLHVSWYLGGTVLTSTYRGGCSNSPGAWVGQPSFYDAPDPTCEANCECSPGQVQGQGCGRCGSQQRVCQGNCHWGGWGGCGGEGPCWPGQVDETNCCDCGKTRRACNGACQWDGWSACDGPDPAGPPACDTGLLGVCKVGAQRCIQGCLTCTQTTFPTDEVCDDLDNNCDGASDEGSPKVLGATPPVFAATVVDASFPRQLSSGAPEEAWILFRNVGRETWKAGEAWLRADAPTNGTVSQLEPPKGWASYDVAAVLENDVPPGEVAKFVFPIELASVTGDDSAETFSLIVGSGVPIACPEGSLEVAVVTVAPPEADAGAEPNKKTIVKAKIGCTELPATALALLGLVALRRRRS